MAIKTETKISQMTDEQIGEVLNSRFGTRDWHTVQSFPDGVEVTYANAFVAWSTLSVMEEHFPASRVSVEGNKVVIV